MFQFRPNWVRSMIVASETDPIVLVRVLDRPRRLPTGA
jgi:hypothetical protein